MKTVSVRSGVLLLTFFQIAMAAEPIVLQGGESFRIGKEDVGLIVKCEGGVQDPLPPSAPQAKLFIYTFKKSADQSGISSPYQHRYVISGRIEGDFERLEYRLNNTETTGQVSIDYMGTINSTVILNDYYNTGVRFKVIYQGIELAYQDFNI